MWYFFPSESPVSSRTAEGIGGRGLPLANRERTVREAQRHSASQKAREGRRQSQIKISPEKFDVFYFRFLLCAATPTQER